MNKDKMELEEAIKVILNSYIMSTKHCLDDENKELKQAIKTVLQELENSIHKKKIEDKIKEIHRNISQIKDEYAIHQNDYIKNKLDSIENTLQELLEEEN